MAKKKKRRSYPKFVMWSAADQRRLVDTVERLHSIVNDLVMGWLKEENRRLAKRKPKQAAQDDGPTPSNYLNVGGESDEH